MAFIETPRFPTCVSLRALSKPRYKTTVIPTLSGYNSRNIEWAQPLHSFDFAKVMSQTEHDSLLAFFHAAQGMGHQFRVRDPGDHSTTTANGCLLGLSANSQVVAAPGVGSGHRSYIAGKRYVAGSQTTYRWLQKLVPGTVSVYRGGVLQVDGSPGDIQIDETTGKIDFEFDESKGIVSHGIGANHNFIVSGAFSPNFVNGGRVYVTGVTGTAASVLNGIAHELSSVAGTTLTTTTDTTGLTASGGTAYYYPQPSETLTIVCEFDVPCIFSSDEASFDLFQKTPDGEFYYQWTGINLEEDRLALPSP